LSRASPNLNEFLFTIGRKEHPYFSHRQIKMKKENKKYWVYRGKEEASLRAFYFQIVI
jgi:hypothetical protein